MRRKPVLFVLIAALLVGGALLVAARPSYAQGHDHDSHAAHGRVSEGEWPFEGDRGLPAMLIGAAAQATGLRPRQIEAQVEAGQSIAAIAAAEGVTTDEVLAVFDAYQTRRFARAAESGRLPQSLADGRGRWFQAAGRQMVGQPGLAPAYPGVHQLHVTMISAATDVSERTRAEIREGLYACGTLNAMLAEEGLSGEDAVSTALAWLDGAMATLVADGSLSEAQRDLWHDGLEAALTNMAAAPGLHVAGKECSR